MKPSSRVKYEAMLVDVMEPVFLKWRRGASDESVEEELRIGLGDALHKIVEEELRDFIYLFAADLDTDETEGSVMAKVRTSRDGYARDRANVLAPQIVQSTRQRVAQGASMWDETSEDRMFGIARTEVTAAHAAAAELLILLPGFTKTPRWITMLDERVCAICRPLHGQGREVYGGRFPSGPPAHPRCRCKLVFV